MRIEGFIAVRYLFSRKEKSVVTVISWISLIGLMVSTAALIVVLSVYNGIGELTKSLFSTFDPELIIEPSEGKTLHTADIEYAKIVQTEGVESVTQMVDETAWMTYGDRQAIVRLRGVDEGYRRLSGLDTLLYEGEYALQHGEATGLIVGGEVFYNLGMKLRSPRPAAIHIPKRGTYSMGHTMEQAFNTGYAYPSGMFFIQQDIDKQYVVTEADFVRRLMNYSPDECTAIALKLRPEAKVSTVKKRLSALLSSQAEEGKASLRIKDRFDQQPLYFKIFRTERLGIYMILSLIVLISTLSLVASLSLLIINKQKDIFILRSMGMTREQLRRAFATEGLLICTLAAVAGLAVGAAICLIQQQTGIVRMGDGNFVVNAFPVQMQAEDFIITFLLVMIISCGAVGLTVARPFGEKTA